MNRPINEKINELRKGRGITQEKLGEMLGVSSQAVSKWEKGESMPDIMLLPRLCEVLGVSCDSLLEVPASAKKESCMTAFSEYAKNVGRVNAIFEASEECANSLDNRMVTGSVYQGNDGISLHSKMGICFTVKGAEILKEILNTKHHIVLKICSLLSDEDVLKVISCFELNLSLSSAELCEKSELSSERVEKALFSLMKMGYAECDTEEKFTLSVPSYSLFVAMCGMYLASEDGKRAINSITKNYLPNE